MKTNTRKIVEVDITLTHNEATYLRDLLQNFPGDPEDEDPDQYEIRGCLFDALAKALKK